MLHRTPGSASDVLPAKPGTSVNSSLFPACRPGKGAVRARSKRLGKVGSMGTAPPDLPGRARFTVKSLKTVAARAQPPSSPHESRKRSGRVTSSQARPVRLLPSSGAVQLQSLSWVHSQPEPPPWHSHKPPSHRTHVWWPQSLLLRIQQALCVRRAPGSGTVQKNSGP